MDSYRKVLLGVSLVSIAVITSVVAVVYATSGKAYTEANARKEIDALEEHLLSLLDRSTIEGFNPLAAFVEYTNTRLDAFDQIHKFGHDSEVYHLYQEKVQLLIEKYFSKDR